MNTSRNTLKLKAVVIVLAIASTSVANAAKRGKGKVDPEKGVAAFMVPVVNWYCSTIKLGCE